MTFISFYNIKNEFCYGSHTQLYYRIVLNLRPPLIIALPIFEVEIKKISVFYCFWLKLKNNSSIYGRVNVLLQF